MSGRRYAIVTPCRDEAEYARRTLDAVCGQSVPPTKWVIVDDGSTDGTTEILKEYAERYSFIEIVTREQRGKRAVGPGVVDAFYAGLDTIAMSDFDYVVKLDLDLDLPQGYFESLMVRMEADPRLGCCSGKPYFPGPTNTDKGWDGELVSELCGDEMCVGMIKFYRVSAFEQIGGFVREVMWDGIDCHRCRMLGWRACSWDDPELRFLHLRPMGSSQKGILTGRARHGFGQYFMGTGPIYMAASAAFRVLHRPVLIGSAAMMWGYLESWLKGKPRYGDAAFRRFLRRYQWACLFSGKSAATRRLDAEQAGVWETSSAGALPAAQ
ncbi:MAG: glycosyltransferase family A protein [Planctomycetota bacterium]